MTGDADDGAAEPSRSIGRVEAFSDGVIAIIITIMVLELKAPVADGLGPLLALWPVLLAYLLSYVYVGIYWANHHRLLGHARVVTNGLVWSNLALLFALSLVPFTTAYLGDHHFDRLSTGLYLMALLLPVAGYVSLQAIVRRTGARHAAALLYHRRTMRKGAAGGGLYLAGLALTRVSPWFGIAAAGLVALLWLLPDSRLDRWFAADGAITR